MSRVLASITSGEPLERRLQFSCVRLYESGNEWLHDRADGPRIGETGTSSARSNRPSPSGPGPGSDGHVPFFRSSPWTKGRPTWVQLVVRNLRIPVTRGEEVRSGEDEGYVRGDTWGRDVGVLLTLTKFPSDLLSPHHTCVCCTRNWSFR